MSPSQPPPRSPSSPSSPPPTGGLMENLAGTIDIMLGRASGKSRIDLSANGIVLSFAGLVLAGLVDISALSILYNGQAAPEVSKTYFIFGHLMVALIGYATSFVALYLLCRAPSEQRNFFSAIAIHNWASPIVSVAFLPLIIIATVLGTPNDPASENDLLTVISVFWIGILIFVGIRLLRISLDIYTGKAVVYFVITTAVSLVTTEGLEAILGLASPS